MFGSSRNTPPSGWQPVGNEGTFNFWESWLHNWSWFYWWLPSSWQDSDRVIVMFSRRKDCKQVLQTKKDLKDLNTDDLDLPRGTKIFVNQSLCPYIIVCYGLKVSDYVVWVWSIVFFISGGTVKVKIAENSWPLAITHWMTLQFISLILICHYHQNHHS